MVRIIVRIENESFAGDAFMRRSFFISRVNCINHSVLSQAGTQWLIQSAAEFLIRLVSSRLLFSIMWLMV